MTNLEVMLSYAFSLVGTPYKWGGASALEGFDCSGFVQEILRAGKLWPPGGDRTAKGIYDTLRGLGRTTVPPKAGALSFYGHTRSTITHVGFCLNPELMIEAGGGDSSVKDRATAAARGAVVRVRPIKARNDYLECLMP